MEDGGGGRYPGEDEVQKVKKKQKSAQTAVIKGIDAMIAALKASLVHNHPLIAFSQTFIFDIAVTFVLDPDSGGIRYVLHSFVHKLPYGVIKMVLHALSRC